MNLVFLSPEFPSHYHRFCRRLMASGVTVLGLGQTPFEQLHPELRDALHDYYRVGDLHHYDELVRALGYFTHRHGKLNWVDSLNEYWLETEARLRADFNIPGLKLGDLPRIKRKSAMKEVFRAAGLPVVHGRLYTGPDDARAFIEAVGYPIVAKPDIGVGANNTWCLRNPADLERFLSTAPQDYFLEEFVPGVIQTFDGLVGREGEVLFYSSLQYPGVMEMVNEGLDTSYFSRREIPQDLMESGFKILKAFDARMRFFHFEFFRTPDGNLITLEVNMRPPGGLTIDMFNFAGDLDLYDVWARAIAGLNPGRHDSRPFHCCYVGRKSAKSYVHSHDEVLSHCGARLVSHQPMDAVFHAAMGDYAYILRSPILDEVLALSSYIQIKK